MVNLAGSPTFRVIISHHQSRIIIRSGVTCQIVATTPPDLSVTKSVDSPTQTVPHSMPLTAEHLCIMYTTCV